MTGMDEYIEMKALSEAFDNADADVVEEYEDGGSDWGFSHQNILEVINSVPAADVAPVVHGRWERIGIKGRKGLPIYHCCSVCGIVSAAFRSEWEGLRGPWKFCPNCGADMRGKNDE